MTSPSEYDIQNSDGLQYMTTLKDKSVQLILTDPPYIISKDSGMNRFVNKVKSLEKSGKNAKTSSQWESFKAAKGYTDDKYKTNYIKYGNTSGKKYGYKTDFGKWDNDFSIEKQHVFTCVCVISSTLSKVVLVVLVEVLLKVVNQRHIKCLLSLCQRRRENTKDRKKKVI